jgi:hypothetical protein
MVGVFSVKTCHLSRATATHTGGLLGITPGQAGCSTRYNAGVIATITKKESIKEKDLPRSGKTERDETFSLVPMITPAPARPVE